MKPTGRTLNVRLCELFGWGAIHFLDRSEYMEWTAEQIAAELRGMGWRKVLWGWSGDGAYAEIWRRPDCRHVIECFDHAIPELDRPRTALGWLALEVAK